MASRATSFAEGKSGEVGAMSMQATRLTQPELTSGTFETEKPREAADRAAPDAISEAHLLATKIEELLVPRSGETEPYGMRLARALAQSLIDQLADLSRDSKRAKLA